MTTLHDRLAELADDAPPGGPSPDLWARGRRVARRRRLGTLAIVATALVLLASIAAVDWQRQAAPPAPARGPVGLPDHVWSPSPWLPTVDRPGRLVALQVASRGHWTGEGSAPVGISATTGEYAFFDLPGRVADGELELAPDGRHVAYWLTGRTTGTPETESGPVTGLAVYDTETGETVRHPMPTAHGLRPSSLSWADARTVVFAAGQIVGGDDAPGIDQSLSTFGAVTTWTLGKEPRPLSGALPEAGVYGAAHGKVLLEDTDDQLRLVDLAGRSPARSLRLPSVAGGANGLHFVAVGRDERLALVAGLETPGPVSAGVPGDLRVVPHTANTLAVVDWLEDDTIVTLASADAAGTRFDLEGVQVATGASRRLARLTGGGDWQFATDLLSAPPVPGVRPPSPMDPRVTTGLMLGTVLLAAGALVLWRRRARA